LASLFCDRGLPFLVSNQGQFPGIEPATSATGALVDFDAAFGAGEVPVEFHAGAARTLTLTGFIYDQALVALDVQQGLSRNLALFVNFLQFEGIKPDPTATTLADVDSQVADLECAQFIRTGWAFHRLAFL
jgi:hypothetical protein